jgi:uncharacterized protein (DUF2252 family)
MDAVRQIQAFNAGRDPEALRIKYRTLRGGAFAFLRGTGPLFYERVPRGGVFRSAPLVWSCGDLHLENFGSYKADNRLVYFDINDFDDAALAPASWDLVRLLASVWVAADRIAVTPGEARRLCNAFLDAYAASLAAGKAYWMERETAQGLIRELLDGLRDRDRPRFLAGRTRIVGKRRVLRVDGKKALAATATQRAAVLDFMAKFAPTQPDPRFFTVLDVARRIAGVGSLGLERYVVLVHGKGSPDGNYLLDLKRSLPSALAARLQVEQPEWPSEAHRVVAIQRRLQAVAIAFLRPVEVAGKAFVLRGLQPSEDRVTLDRSIQKAAELEQVVATMGRLVAWAQLRSAGRQGSAGADELIDFGQRRKWKDKLLAASQDCAAQLRADSAAFDAAYDDGAFDV